MNTPKPLSNAEWREIIDVPEVKESWGLAGNETPEEFADSAYGVKFDFASGGPGYVGEMYLLSGDALGEPFTLIRKEGKLVVV